MNFIGTVEYKNHIGHLFLYRQAVWIAFIQGNICVFNYLQRLTKQIIPLMIKFYEKIPQSKFVIMISLYRAFAEDSRERLYQLGYHAYSTPYSFIQYFNKELDVLKGITEG